jgi:glycosyltransferase involved in cell wall biosynthesis
MSERKIKLLLIGTLPPPEGGVRVSFKQLVEDLKKSDRFDIYLIDLTSRKGLSYKAIFYVLQLAKIFLRLRKVDVVSFQAPTKYVSILGPILFLFAKFWRKPIVLRRFAGDCHDLFKEQNRLVQWIQKSTVLNADLSFYQTHYQVDFFRGLVKNRVKWFSTNRVIPAIQKAKFNPSAKKFIFLGWVREEKGIQVLIDCFNAIDGNVSLDIYGCDLMNVGSLINGHPRIQYKGVLRNQQVYETLIKYDALVLPSHWKGEGYPGSIIEAFALNIPVIATSLPGIKEIVKHGETGLLVEPKNVESLRDAIMVLSSDASLYGRIVDKIKIEKYKFSSQYWANYFSDEVEELVGNRKTRK